MPTEAVAAGCSLLWWPQQLAAADKLWDVAAAASAAVRRERDAKGGLAFWKRLHADKTMAEVAALPEQPFLPPFTVRRGPALALLSFSTKLRSPVSVALPDACHTVIRCQLSSLEGPQGLELPGWQCCDCDTVH